MTVIGITGSFGTGKTTVATMLADLGAQVIDADKIAHRLIRRGAKPWKEIVRHFGKKILNEDKSINRKKLAKEVFGKRKSLKILCNIIHPTVIEKIKKKLNQIKLTKPNAIVIIDAPLLIEVGLESITDKLIVVKTTTKEQLTRCIRRRGLTESQIRSRIQSQLPLKEKKRLADYIIDNSGMLKQTRKQVEKIWKEIKGELK